jgi:hypothetical protein
MKGVSFGDDGSWFRGLVGIIVLAIGENERGGIVVALCIYRSICAFLKYYIKRFLSETQEKTTSR